MGIGGKAAEAWS